MEMAGNQALASLISNRAGKIPDDIPVVPALGFDVVAGFAGVLQTLLDCQRKGWWKVVDCGSCESVVQYHPQQAVTMVAPVDLVAMAEEEPPALHRNNRRSGVDFCSELISKEISQMKVVVALEVEQPATAAFQGRQGIQYGAKLLEWLRRKAQPEIEQVTHDEKGISLSFQVTKKMQQQTIILMAGRCQMGIGKKDRTHNGDCAVTPVRSQQGIEV